MSLEVSLHQGSLVAQSCSRVCVRWHLPSSPCSDCCSSKAWRDGNFQAKHIQVLRTCIGWRRTTHASFFCLCTRPPLSYCYPAAVSQVRVLRVEPHVTSKDAHKMDPAVQMLSHILTSFNIFELSLITLQIALLWAGRYMQQIGYIRLKWPAVAQFFWLHFYFIHKGRPQVLEERQPLCTYILI